MFDILIWLPGHLAMKARPLVPSSNRQTKMIPGKLTLSVTFVLQLSEFPVVKQLNCLLSADYAHNVSMSDSEFGTNGSDRGKSPRRPHRWALKKNSRAEILFFLKKSLSFFLSKRLFAPQSFVRSQTLSLETTTPRASRWSSLAEMAPCSSSGGAKPTPSRSTSSSCCCRCSASARPPSSPGSPSWVRSHQPPFAI